MGWGFKPDWLVRRRAGELLARVERDPTPDNLAALQAWRNSDPRHAAVLDRSETMLRRSTRLPGSNMAAAPAPPATVKTSHLALAATIAGGLLILSGAFFILMWPRTSPSIEAVFLTSRVGQIREIHLSDGSRITLDTASAVRVEIGKSRREALVEQGRARFSVAPLSTPFKIRSGPTIVRIDRGVVDVSAAPLQPVAELIEGAAQVTSGNRDGVQNLPLGAVRADWTEGRLSFDGARLADVLFAANRYSIRQVFIGDQQLANLRVTGVYKTGDPEGLARSLAAAFALRVATTADGNLVLTRRPAAR